MNAQQLTEQLVSLPTHVRTGTSQDETAAAEFVEDYLRKTYPWLTVTRQRVSDRRFNVVATTPGTPELLLAGHLDTVDPKTGWQHNLYGEMDGDRLFGTGAYDMKAGVACIMAALAQTQRRNGLTLLFYCDEEYDFAGMLAFIEQWQGPVGRLAAVAEPTDLKISHAFRGLIEITASVRGLTGHAARPHQGVNAIDALYASIEELRIWLNTQVDPILGKPSCNLARLNGGLLLSKDDEPFALGQEGNNIADYAQAIIDIRPTRPDLKAQAVVDRLQAAIEARLTKPGIPEPTFKIRHDYGSLNTNRDDLTVVQQIVTDTVGEVEYSDAANEGYGDGQMLFERCHVPVIQFGPKGGGMHQAEEWVSIDSLGACTDFYAKLIDSYCTDQPPTTKDFTIKEAPSRLTARFLSVDPRTQWPNDC